MNNTSEVKVGQYVKALSGRDRGKIFVVYEILDDRFVMIVDGDYRKITRPKKKNIKHLQKINKVSTLLRERILNGEPIQNLMIKQEIAKLDYKF